MMNKNLDAKIKMFAAVEDNYLLNQPRYDLIDAMESNMIVFMDRNNNISLLVPLAEESTKPTTKDKDKLLVTTCENAVIVSKSIQSYANSIGDLKLEGTMNWTVPKLLRKRMDLIGPICVGIHTVGTDLLTEATPFNLTQAKLDALAANNVAWATKEAATRNKLVEIGEAKKHIAKLVNENMKLLSNRLDPMVYTLMETDPSAVVLWDENRKIVNLPTTHTQAKVTVKDITNGLPVFSAEVQLVNGIVMMALTNEDGEAIYHLTKNGVFELNVNAPGFVPFHKAQVRMYLGKINRILVELQPAAAQG